MDIVHKIGRRKTAVARIYLSKGKGNITVNKKDFKNYFTTATLQYKVQQALMLTDNLTSYDVKVNVYGGGVTGQAEAIRLAITRALVSINEEYRLILKPEGLLTRDPRMVERKKFGQKKHVKNSSSLNVNIWFRLLLSIINNSLVSKYIRLVIKRLLIY
jgi:Ribosomal protein S9